MLRRLALVAGVALAALVVASPANAGGRVTADKPLPFKYSYEIIELTPPPAEPENPDDLCLFENSEGNDVPGLPVSFIGDGTGSRIGRSEAAVEFCLALDFSESYGTSTLTAANGDLLGFEFRGFPNPDGSANATIIEDTTFGTGRFANASVAGGGVAGEFDGFFDATIAYDASKSNAMD